LTKQTQNYERRPLTSANAEYSHKSYELFLSNNLYLVIQSTHVQLTHKQAARYTRQDVKRKYKNSNIKVCPSSERNCAFLYKSLFRLI